MCLPKTYNITLTIRKHQANPKLQAILQNIRPVLLKGIKTMKDKERLGNCHRLEVTEVNMTINATWCPGLDPGTERGHEQKNWGESVELLKHWDSFSTPKGLVSSFQLWLLDALKSDRRLIITAVIYFILNVRQTHLHTLCPLILPSTSPTLFYWGDAEQKEVRSCDHGHNSQQLQEPIAPWEFDFSTHTLNYHAWSMGMLTELLLWGTRKLHEKKTLNHQK